MRTSTTIIRRMGLVLVSLWHLAFTILIFYLLEVFSVPPPPPNVYLVLSILFVSQVSGSSCMLLR